MQRRYLKHIRFKMKHVFVINSHTTFLTSVGAVDYLKLADACVIFVYIRSYRNRVTKIPYRVVDATDLANYSNKMSTRYEEYVEEVDGFVKQVIGSKYCLYVPHLWNYFFQLLYTNRLCRRVSYVQEGGAVQTKVYEVDVPLVERMRSWVRHAILGRRTFECKWYRRGIIYKQLWLDSYAMNDVYFHCLPSHNHIVTWPSCELDMALEADAPIFIFDGYVKNGLVESEVYMTLCEKLVAEQARMSNYVKFHPAQSTKEREAILSFFEKQQKKVEVMSDEIPMEYVIVQFKNLTFVGFTSSLLYYAHDFGHKVICAEDSLLNTSSEFRSYVKNCGFQTFAETYKVQE